MKKFTMNNLDYEKRKKVRLIAVITLIVVLNALLIWVFATNSGENGESALADVVEHQTEAPEGYTAITNVDGLKAMSLNGKYILMDNIDLTGTTWDVIRNFFKTFYRNNRWK